jgi:hypothetical protein
MKNKKYLALLNLIVLGCATVNPTDVKPVSTATPSFRPTGVTSSTPASPVPTVIQSQTPAPTPVNSATPKPSPVVSATPGIADSGQIKLLSGYIRTPNNSFMVREPFELEMGLALDKLPDEKKFITFFDVYDIDSNPKNSHFSLSIDNTKNFIIRAKNSGEEVNLTVPFSELDTGKYYVISFRRDNNKITFSVNGKLLFTRDFGAADFKDQAGRRVLNIGANLNGENGLVGNIDYVEVKDVLYYDFKNNFSDSGKFFLDATPFGEFRFLTATPQPTAVPTVIPSVSVSPTPSAVIPERVVKDQSDKLTLDLNVYKPKDKDQFDDCVDKKKRENTTRTSNEIQIDCLNGYGQYTSQGLDFGTGSLLANENGDLRFITDIDQFGNQLTIHGNDGSPEVLIIDIGQKLYEGIDATYIANKVDYTNINRIFSSSAASSKVTEDHVYAVKTSRYGEKPRYAKLVINQIITDDYEDKAFSPAKINSQPQFVASAEGTRFDPASSYTYYIAVYDGTGETVPLKLDTLAPDPNATTSKVEFTFELPYNSRGYTIYRKDDTQIYQIGPVLANAETQITFTDTANKGVIVTKIPTADTTTKSAFKPNINSRPVSVIFSYYFDGDGDLRFN